MWMCVLVVVATAGFCPAVAGAREHAGGTSKVRLHRKLANIVRDDFLSFAIDDGIAKKDWEHLDLSSERLKSLVRGLLPAVLRFGGTQADCLIFQQDVSLFRGTAKCAPFQKETTPFQLTAESWSQLSEFVSSLNLTLLFDLNALLRDPDGRWNGTNAGKVVSTLAEEGLSVVWQLGNEPNSYQHKFNYSVAPETLAADFLRLRQLLGPAAQLVGPDVNRPKVKGQLEQQPVDMPAQLYLQGFLPTAGAALNAVTFHQYYFDGRTATVADFTDLRHLAVLQRQIAAVRRVAAGAAIWLSETGSAWGGGAPGLSDAYLAGFLWLDKLGVAARQGVQLVVRQALYGGHYGLLNAEMRPNPDYWLSYLYKLVMGPRVLKVRVSGPETVRMYCHCGHRYLPHDSVSCFTLNLGNAPEKVRLDSSMQEGGIQYMLTPPNGNLTSRGILCNGQLLQLEQDRLPAMPVALLEPSTSLTLPAYSMAFQVFRRAAPRSCLLEV
ncbi:heparanase-like [Pollicipes pollicipes]|uniref:heparanase-like n=1 Tax=Pollicipes pollicipes TaxID=41117 RepID=UPI0018851B74|nr:heparanase-like [Pollicipes pollicipes]